MKCDPSAGFAGHRIGVARLRLGSFAIPEWLFAYVVCGRAACDITEKTTRSILQAV